MISAENFVLGTALISVSMMLRYSLNEPALAAGIERAVNSVLDQGFRTADIYSEGTKIVSTSEMGDAITNALKA